MTSEQPRPYRKRRRAELEAETRLRITEAAMELHGSVGPARTTISAVAERAGVQRATVYRHFGDDGALFAACSSHWLTLHPLPDTTAWTAIRDPGERLRTALRDVYAWFEHGESMLERTTRDMAVVPALRAPMTELHGWLDAAAETMLRGRPERGARRRRARAAIGHAFTFETWRSLVCDQGVSQATAVDLMTRLVEPHP